MSDIDIDLLNKLMDEVTGVPGDFAEFGVWRGATFRHIYVAALKKNRRIRAIDSFRGMPAPVLAGDAEYKRGLFDVGGSLEFSEKFPNAIIHEGFIPEILEEIDTEYFAFVHLDIDHEYTTGLMLKWIWPRLAFGGILMCHDYYRDAMKLAGKAINEWMDERNITSDGIDNTSIWFVR